MTKQTYISILISFVIIGILLCVINRQGNEIGNVRAEKSKLEKEQIKLLHDNIEAGFRINLMEDSIRIQKENIVRYKGLYSRITKKRDEAINNIDDIDVDSFWVEMSDISTGHGN